MAHALGKNSPILIVGHNDQTERSLTEGLRARGFNQVLSSSALGLNVLNQKVVTDFFIQHQPEYVFLGSTRSGGIGANQKNPGEFIQHNLASATQIISLAKESGVKKLVYIASSCVYPARCRQPIKEEYLLTGPLEPSNEAYAVAKIAGIKLCQAFRQQYGFNAVVMVPATLYGPGQSADLDTSHVLGALIHKFYAAVKNKDAEVVVWGSGRPRREFLFSEDFVDAALFLMEEYDGGEIVNVGWGQDVAIKELAMMVAQIAGFKNKIVFDRTKPDGTMQKLLDSTRMTRLGWRPKVNLEDGIRRTLAWYQQQTK